MYQLVKNIEDIVNDVDINFKDQSENNLNINKISDLIAKNSVDIQENGMKKSESYDFSCEECNFKSNGKRSITKHKKAVHMSLHKCDECKYNAINESYLKQHIKLYHEDVKITNSKKRKTRLTTFQVGRNQRKFIFNLFNCILIMLPR